MELSLFFFANDSTLPEGETGGRYRLLMEAARFADTHGFRAVWTPERHFHSFGGVYPNPSVTSAAIAAVTRRIGIRAGSAVAPLHDPLRLAEEWSMVDNLSEGRTAVSFGSGWHPHDFVLRPERYADRHAITESTIDTVRRLWRGETVLRTNGSGEEVPVRVYPPPVQPELPIWLTGAGSVDTFRAAGRMGAGLLTHLVKQGADVLAANIAEYRKAFVPNGAAIAAPGHVTLMVHTFVGPDESVLDEIREPMRQYVRSSLSLFSTGNTAPARPVGREVTQAQRQQVIDLSVERYFKSLGLFGSVERAVQAVERFRALGIDELACLIDFGVPTATVLTGLEYLDLVRRKVS
jgi:natural product biosynthesis luciferase-like monooxygenase protein